MTCTKVCCCSGPNICTKLAQCLYKVGPKFDVVRFHWNFIKAWWTSLAPALPYIGSWFKVCTNLSQSLTWSSSFKLRQSLRDIISTSITICRRLVWSLYEVGSRQMHAVHTWIRQTHLSGVRASCVQFTVSYKVQSLWHNLFPLTSMRNVVSTNAAIQTDQRHPKP